MMDHYKSLGLNRNATKDEIKEAFRRLAMEFHPDKHSHSPKSVKDGATLRFKQASEAYEVLMDDHKRADYNNLRYNAGRASGYKSGTGFNSSSGYGYGYYGHPRTGPNYSYSYYSGGSNGFGFVSKFEVALRFLTTRSFLLNIAFAGALLGGTVLIDASRDALWKMHNPGKSFEDAMESIENAKAGKYEI